MMSPTTTIYSSVIIISHHTTGLRMMIIVILNTYVSRRMVISLRVLISQLFSLRALPRGVDKVTELSYADHLEDRHTFRGPDNFFLDKGLLFVVVAETSSPNWRWPSNVFNVMEAF